MEQAINGFYKYAIFFMHILCKYVCIYCSVLSANFFGQNNCLNLQHHERFLVENWIWLVLLGSHFTELFLNEKIEDKKVRETAQFTK